MRGQFVDICVLRDPSQSWRPWGVLLQALPPSEVGMGQVQPILRVAVPSRVDIAQQPYPGLSPAAPSVCLRPMGSAHLGTDCYSGGICLTLTGSSDVPNPVGVVLPVAESMLLS